MQHEVFKVRARNSDAKKGKSGGYRIIYHFKPGEAIVLITIYSKSEQADVAAADIRRIIAAQEQLSSEGETDNGANQHYRPSSRLTLSSPVAALENRSPLHQTFL